MAQIRKIDDAFGGLFSVEGDRGALADEVTAAPCLDRLRTIAADEERPASEKVGALLRLGVDWLGGEQAHLARIDVAGGTHTVVDVSGPHPIAARGQTRALPRTYCRTVLAEDAVLALADAPADGWEADPAYDEFRARTYLGSKVVVDGSFYGTLSVVDREARDDPFTRAEVAGVRLLADAAGAALGEGPTASSPQPTPAQLNALFASSPNMINIHDREGTLIAPNPRLCEKTGYTKAELTGMKVWELDREATPERARAFWHEMEPGDRARWEGAYRRKDGTTFPVEVDLRRLDVAGKPRFIATSRDITERKGVEQELRNTKRLLETTFESLAEAVLVVDPAEREIIACNAAVEDVLGYEKEELIGKCTEKLHTSPAAYEHFGDISEPVLEEEGVFQHQYQMQRKEGTIIDTEHVVTPLQNERWPEGVVSIIRDITERKEAVEQLREERDLLSRIFETSPAAITVLNTEGEFMEVSDRAKDVLGLEKSEVTERTYDDPAWDIRGPEGGPIPDEDLPFARVTATGEPVYDIEHRIAWPDGTHRLLSVSGAPLHTPDGELEGAVFHIDDITERRAAKDALQEERDRFATLFRNLSTPVVHGRPDADGSLRVESVNERFETVFGYKESDIRGDDLQGLIVPDEETDTAESMRRRLLSGAPVNREVRRRAADGLRDFRVQVALRDGDRPTEGFAIYTDVTDRKERERMLARRKALLEAQAEAIIDGLLVVDTDRTVSFFNDRFLKIWDVSVENFKRARPDVSTGKLLEVMENLLSDPDSFREKVEYLHDHPDKKDRDVIRLTDGRWLDQYSAPIVNNDNHFGRLWIFRDVTDQRRMLERLLEVQEEERRRIDQEIHDEMGGLLTSLQFTVDLARRTTQDADAQGEPLDQLEELISELATVSRTISRKLYPSALAERGLAEALSDLINELKTEHDLHVDFYSEIEPGDCFSAPIERTVYWIVQEILMGIVRRDDVDEAQAIANRRDEQIYLHFFDERVAFPSSTQDGTGDFRFQAIQRRVEWLDGTVRIDTIPDEGTRLSVVLPVRHRFPGR